MTIILASQSPRRRELLERMGLKDFQTVSPDVDERAFDGLPPAALVRTLSREKALAVVTTKATADSVVIAADTVVALNGTILGKPRDDREAAKMLSALSGLHHQVYTGVTVIHGDEILTDHAVTTVTFRPLSEREIAQYVRTGEPRDKAGAYGIQGYGALLIEGISGDYYNVMGLPICRLAGMLAHFGVDCLELAGGN